MLPAPDSEQRSQRVRRMRFPGRIWLALAGVLLVVPLAQSAPSGATSPSSTTVSTAARDLKPLPGQSITQLPSGQSLLVGGRRDSSTLAKIALYDPIKKQTTTIGATLGVARSQHTATLMADGTVLILGGRDNAGNVVQTAESFDPSSKRLQTLALPAILPRAEHRATVLADGRLLITGGIDAKGSALYDAEVLNPFSQEIEVINLKTETARFSHLVALLPAHTVQLWGGIGSDRKPVKSAERFDPETLQFKPYSTAAVTQALAALTNDEPPRLVDSEPADAATHIGVGQVLAVRFSKQMDVTTLNAHTVTLFGVTGPVSARITLVEGGLVLFVWPDQQLRPASDYSLMIKGAKDTRNQSLDFTVVAFKTDAIDSGAASGTGATPFAGSLAGANQGSGAGLAINGRATADVVASTRQTDATTISDSDWNPEIVHYKGSWTSGRVFKHSRDYARGQAERQAFLDTLSPVAKAKIQQQWRDQNLLPETGSIGAASAVLKPAASHLKAGPGTLGSISGQILRLDGQPLAGVTLKLAGQTAKSDASGEFLLQNAPLGNQVLEIDGRSASRSDSIYGRFDYQIEVQAGLNDLNFTIWMPRLDTAHAVKIPSPTINEVVVTNPNLPGLELRIPPGTIIRDVDGKIVNEVSITPIPLDQTPFPMPYREVPMFFTIQPGGATLHSVSAQASPGAKLIYPNYTHQPAGARLQLFDYDPKGRGWYIYTQGTISPDGNSIKPDQPFVIYQFTATSAASGGGNAPEEGPPPCEGSDCCESGSGGGGGTDGDPVACHEGLFLESNVDLALADIMPLSLTRTYRQKDANQRAFGIGASHDLDMYLSFVNQSGYTADAIDVVRANGGRERFVAPSGSKDYRSAVFQSNHPGSFYKAELRTSNGSWGGEFIVTRKDGMRYGFSYYVSRLKWIEDRDHNRISLFRDTSGRIATVVSPNGRWIDFEYVATNCANCVTRAYDNAGRSVSYEYDASGQLTKVTNAVGGITTYAYDSAYRMTTVKEPVGQTTGKFKVTNGYDTNGRVQKQTYADGTTNLFAYTLDTNSKVIATNITHERGDIRRITYGANGFMLTDTRAQGKTEQQTVTYTRNADDVRTDIKDGLGRVTHYDYDAAGNVTKMTKLYGTANAVAWRYTYDPVFNLDLASVTDPLGHTTNYSYDSSRHLTRVQDALGHKTDLTYNGSGQVATVTRYKGSTPLTTSFTYSEGDLVGITDPLGRTTRFVTDAVGRTVSVTDPLGRLTRSDHDGVGRVTAVTDAQGNIVKNTYDGNGNLLSFTDARNNVTQWTYDSRNRPLSKKDALQKTEYYAYDAGGNLLFVTDRKGQVSGYQYDNLNRRTQAGYGATSTSSPVYQSTTAFTWDGGNRLTQVVDSLAGTTTRSYDDRFDTLKQEITPEGTVNYAYTANGQRQSMTPSGGTAVSYTYDTANRLTGISQAAGSGNALPATVQNVTLGYDEANRRTSLTLPNGIQITTTWDNASQLTGITYKTSSGTTLGNLTYAYDANGQRLGKGGSLATSNLPAATTAAAIYDANNRLTGWNGSTYSYDNDGNLSGDGARTYTWNSRNQLVAIAGPTPASFTYDGLGRRKSKTVGGITTHYLYDGQNAIQEKNGATVKANLLGGLGLDEWFGRSEGSASVTYLPDALGSTLALANASQAITTSYTYEPYGATTASGSASTNTLAYAGRENDGTGLYYNRARYYHPGTGRFISEDPIGLAGGVNLFGYVGGNPISRTDPKGLFWPAVVVFCEVCPSCCAAAAAATGAAIANICENRAKNPPDIGPPDGWIQGPRRGRQYGPDGLPEFDIDKPHQGNEQDHVHEWPGGQREEPGRPVSPVPQRSK